MRKQIKELFSICCRGYAPGLRQLAALVWYFSEMSEMAKTLKVQKGITVVSLCMTKDKTVKTNQGILEIWEHQLGAYNAAIQQKYASRIFNKQTHRNDLKIHTSAKELESYIDMLNLIVPLK